MKAASILSAILLLAGSAPALLLAFGAIDWTAEQVAQYGVFLGVVAVALSQAMGVKVEAKVTPVANPRDDAGNVLTPGPIGSDDPEELPPI
jgi:hypothetical protein